MLPSFLLPKRLPFFLHLAVLPLMWRRCVCQTHLEHTTLDRVTVMSQVIYDPDPTDTIVPQDKEWVRDYYEFPDDDELPNNLGRWLLRIQMASKVMIDKKLTMKEIGERIFMEFPNDELDCIWTDDNSDDLVLRIRIKQQPGAAGADGLGGGGGGGRRWWGGRRKGRG